MSATNISLKENGLLQFTHGGDSYVFDTAASGALKKIEADGKTLGSAIEDSKTITPIVDRLLDGIKEEGAKISGLTKDHVQKITTAASEEGKKLGAKLTHALGEAEAIASASRVSENFKPGAVRKSLASNPLTETFLTEDTKTALRLKNFNWKKHERFDEIYKKFSDLVKAEKPNTAEIEALLNKNPAFAPDLFKTLEKAEGEALTPILNNLHQKGGLHLESTVESISKTFGERYAEATQLGKKLAELGAEKEGLVKKGADAKKIAAVEKQITEISANFKKAIEGDIGSQVAEIFKKDTPKDVLENIGKASGELGTRIEAAAARSANATGKAAAAGTGFWAKALNFRHTAETAGKDAEKIGKLRGGKIALAAGGTVLAAIVAKHVFFPNKGKHAEAEEQRRTAQQSAALGVA